MTMTMTIYIYILYYTPLPLNLANKQQALLFSVLDNARPRRSGLCPALAILGVRWWPYQIQVLSQKLTLRPGAGAPSREVPSQNCAFCAPKQPLLAKNGPETQSKRANDGKGFTICLENGPKIAKTWPECALFVSYRRKTEIGPYLGLCGSNPNSEGT